MNIINKLEEDKNKNLDQNENNNYEDESKMKNEEDLEENVDRRNLMFTAEETIHPTNEFNKPNIVDIQEEEKEYYEEEFSKMFLLFKMFKFFFNHTFELLIFILI